MILAKFARVAPIFSRCPSIANSKIYTLKNIPLFVQSTRNEGDHFDWKDHQLGLIGSREQVGYGWNGSPCYKDRADYPFPSIRYKEPLPEIQAVREKERGDWRLLSIEEKKMLYRASFCQTFAEFQAPTGEWQSTVGISLFFVSLGIWLYILMRIFVYNELPQSFTKENKEAQLRRMIDLQTNPILGLASEWDYKKNDWKNPGWFTPKNPFVDDCGNPIDLDEV